MLFRSPPRHSSGPPPRLVPPPPPPHPPAAHSPPVGRDIGVSPTSSDHLTPAVSISESEEILDEEEGGKFQAIYSLTSLILITILSQIQLIPHSIALVGERPLLVFMQLHKPRKKRTLLRSPRHLLLGLRLHQLQL